MNSKQQILADLRAVPLPDRPLPAVECQVLTFADPVHQFRTMVEAVGGRVSTAPSDDSVLDSLNEIEAFRQAARVWSLIPAAPSRGGRWDEVEDPHDLESLDFCIVPGELGVAENGAVWIPDRAIRHRVALWIAQHVALVLPTSRIVHNLHEAYAGLQLDSLHFGVFISGPSKTADIEQSLVIGAHGPRSLTVILVDA